MSIRFTVTIAYLIIVGVGFYLLINAILDELEPRYRETVEESLVDSATMLAGILGAEMTTRQDLPGVAMEKAFRDIYRRHLEAVIYDIRKDKVDVWVYVTDQQGIVRFHSRQPDLVGADFSRWNDVYKTLQGAYGARSTGQGLDGEGASVLHVAAPILVEGEIVGVVTVAKPTENVNAFMARARYRLLLGGGILALAVMLAGVAITYWLTLPIDRLTRYARQVRDHERTSPPPLGSASEIKELGAAFEEMREALEGKTYVENYVQGLTHEIKSPLAAIQGASELLEEKELPPERRQRFMANIRREVQRLTDLVNRLLGLTALEARKALAKPESFQLRDLVEEAIANQRPVAEAKGVVFKVDAPTMPPIRGEKFLLLQAIDNLLQNALDFTPAGSEIQVTLQPQADLVELRVQDSGPGVPDYALPRVFERFYSLARPDSGNKSTGLGLAYVREITELHGGKVKLENHPAGGAVAILSFPVEATDR